MARQSASRPKSIEILSDTDLDDDEISTQSSTTEDDELLTQLASDNHSDEDGDIGIMYVLVCSKFYC